MNARNLIHIAVVGLLSSALLAGCASDEEEDFSVGVTAAPLVTVDPAARVADQYIVVFKDSVASKARGLEAAMGRIALRNASSRIEFRYTVVPGFSARLAAEDLDALRKNPDVAYIEQDQLMFATATKPASGALEIDRHDHCPVTDDGTFDDHGCNGSGVLVYIVDTGIRATHTQFTGRVNTARGFTAINDGRGTTDCNGHGSHVASTAAGTGFGMASAATLVPVRVLGCNGSGTNAGVIAGVDHVRTNCGTAKCVANMSLGGGASSALDSAVTNAVNAGIPFAVAAGNSNVDASTSSPARAPAAITVGCASDSGYPGTDGSSSVTRCSFSNFGTVVDIWASGLTVLGADDISDTATQTISGTSMSTPHVAGAIAQFLSCRSTKPTPAQVEAALDTDALTGAMSGSPGLGGAQNLFLCSDFNDADGDACTCPGSVPPPAVVSGTLVDAATNAPVTQSLLVTVEGPDRNLVTNASGVPTTSFSITNGILSFKIANDVPTETDPVQITLVVRGSGFVPTSLPMAITDTVTQFSLRIVNLASPPPGVATAQVQGQASTSGAVVSQTGIPASQGDERLRSVEPVQNRSKNAYLKWALTIVMNHVAACTVSRLGVLFADDGSRSRLCLTLHWCRSSDSKIDGSYDDSEISLLLIILSPDSQVAEFPVRFSSKR